MSVDASVLEEIGKYDQSYKPAERTQTRPGVDTLPDGEYEFTINAAVLGRTQKQGQAILRVELRVDAGPPGAVGQVIERAYFFDTAQKVDYLGADLVTLGFDADQWVASAGRPFSQELPKAIQRLPGIRFAGKKVTTPSEQPSKPYHNLYINRKVGASIAPPTYRQDAAPLAPAPAPSPATTSVEDDVPF